MSLYNAVKDCAACLYIFISYIQATGTFGYKLVNSTLANVNVRNYCSLTFLFKIQQYS